MAGPGPFEEGTTSGRTCRTGGEQGSAGASARVIRSLWFTECTLDTIGERLGLAGKTVSLLARRAGLPPRQATPKSSLVPPAPRKGPLKVAPTPEQIAKTVTDRRPSPPGQPDKAEITLRLVLPRTVLERLSARAIRETRKLEALIQEILEGAAK